MGRHMQGLSVNATMSRASSTRGAPFSNRAPSTDRGGPRRQRGVTSIEYALIGALVALVIVASVTNLGASLSAFYSFVAGEVSNAVARTSN
ncbi:Flp family type IVb pilin [Zeimonas sediminis]|uniref:Flp family type IVb pilin n=1 Tax=Zeimonas sediminis TaxID=2944268 RepID=UPI00300E6AA3